MSVRAKFSASVFCQDVWTLVGEATTSRRPFVVVCSNKYEYYVVAVVSTDGTFRLSRLFGLCKMRSDIAAALGDRTRKSIDIFSLVAEWLTLEQATADVQSSGGCEEERRDVAGENEVLDAEDADGELPLEKWRATIIAEECTHEYIDDPYAKHASEKVQGDDDLLETLSDTFAHDSCEYDEDGFEGEPLVVSAEGSSSSTWLE